MNALFFILFLFSYHFYCYITVISTVDTMHTQLLSTINHSTYSTSYLTQLWSPTSLQYLPHISVLNQAYEEQFQLFSPPMFSLYNFITFIAPQSNPCAVALNYLLCIHQLVSSTFFFCSNHFVIS